MERDFKELRDGLDNLPKKIKILKATLEEMNKGTGPTREADYYDEKQQIRKDMDNLEQVEHDLIQINKDFETKKNEAGVISTNIKKSVADINKMRIEVDKLENCAEGLTALKEQFQADRDKVDDV